MMYHSTFVASSELDVVQFLRRNSPPIYAKIWLLFMSQKPCFMWMIMIQTKERYLTSWTVFSTLCSCVLVTSSSPGFSPKRWRHSDLVSIHHDVSALGWNFLMFWNTFPTFRACNFHSIGAMAMKLCQQINNHLYLRLINLFCARILSFLWIFCVLMECDYQLWNWRSKDTCVIYRLYTTQVSLSNRRARKSVYHISLLS